MDLTPLWRLLLAAGLAAAIGIDRELRSKPAGLRTNIVVAVAAAAFSYTGASVFDGGDPTRVASQVVSGIGFLGGGAIFAAGGKPHGLTTAAALWGSAAIGLAAGVGATTTAVAVVGVTLVALWPLDWIGSRLLDRYGRRNVRLQVLVPDTADVSRVRDEIDASGVRVTELNLRELRDRILIDVVLSGQRDSVRDVLGRLRGFDGVTYVSDGTQPPVLDE